ncbi:MAG: hypothetical protein RLY43_1806 [Bacteroidota bacterium]|jgi:FlaA1/EpsC-like NDP-sugar epimerase
MLHTDKTFAQQSFVRALIFKMPFTFKASLLIIFDLLLIFISVWIAFYLRLGVVITLNPSIVQASIISAVILVPILFFSGEYKVVLRYSNFSFFKFISFQFLIYTAAYLFVISIWGIENIPRTIGFIQPLVLFTFTGFFRIALANFLNINRKKKSTISITSRLLIYGAGESGQKVYSALKNSLNLEVIGYLDDDKSLHNRSILGLTVYDPGKLSNLIVSLGVTDVLIAIPSASRNFRNAILKNLSMLKVAVHTMPSLNDLALGRCDISEIKDLDIEDILGRDPVTPNYQLLNKNISGKVVLVTGAGGSIGAELCRQIMKSNPAKLLLIDQSEFSLYQIHQELLSLCSLLKLNSNIAPLLVSIKDREKLNEILNVFRPDTIYHAAAYKHVPIVEQNPAEGVKNNIQGTINLADLAITYNVKNFVLISTDKAVRPTNVMGATKRVSEMYLQALANEQSCTKFCMVRFGNVLDSSGSVVPKFRKQIELGGPVTVTDPRVTRYFMTIPEAAQLVIQAGALSDAGGEVFLLDMGLPVKIEDLAIKMIELSGLSLRSTFNPDGDIEITYIGLRPGEKLYEELLIGKQSTVTEHPRIMKAIETFLPIGDLNKELNILNELIMVNDLVSVYRQLEKMVPGFSSSEGVVDLAYLTKENNSLRCT